MFGGEPGWPPCPSGNSDAGHGMGQVGFGLGSSAAAIHRTEARSDLVSTIGGCPDLALEFPKRRRSITFFRLSMQLGQIPQILRVLVFLRCLLPSVGHPCSGGGDGLGYSGACLLSQFVRCGRFVSKHRPASCPKLVLSPLTDPRSMSSALMKRIRSYSRAPGSPRRAQGRLRRLSRLCEVIVGDDGTVEIDPPAQWGLPGQGACTPRQPLNDLRWSRSPH